MKNKIVSETALLLFILGFSFFGCISNSRDDDDDSAGVTYAPDIAPGDFVSGIDNPYFPATPGEKWLYEAESEEGFEQTIVEVLTDTKQVWGVEAVVIRDTVYLNGEMIEDTWDWFAQDSEGNIWYFGEDTAEYEDGEVVSTEGAWEAGVDGALLLLKQGVRV